MYLKTKVVPEFTRWIDGISTPIPMADSKKYARYFIHKYMDASQVGSRGAVYDLFEDVANYAKTKKMLYSGQMSAIDNIKTDNLCTVANGIVWAMEHDAFDTVKYDPIEKWGMDVMSGGEHMG